MVDQVTSRVDHKQGRDVNGWPFDQVFTWYQPHETTGVMYPVQQTIYERLQLIYTEPTYLPGINDGEFVKVIGLNDTEWDDPKFDPGEVYEIYLEDGQKFICCWNHKTILLNPQRETQAYYAGSYIGYNGVPVRRIKRVKLTPKFKPDFWMNVITENDQPYRGPGNIMHVSAKLV
ncbi:hypothetical protein HPMBJEAJ_00291 [Aeromonas phage avDM6]|nr:hypothetical protein HPMBJEAJ_00291 [Aeromonas phage avDM6]